MREVYVYWKLPPDLQAAAVARVRALHARLIEEHPGLLARVLTRCDALSGKPATLMEIYARPSMPTGIDDKLEHVIEAAAVAALAGLPAGPRHVEAFDDLAGLT